jgi:hypothetical protein
MAEPMQSHDDATDSQPGGERRATYTIKRRKRFWEVLDPTGKLVCLTVYKRGANEVVCRLRA